MQMHGLNQGDGSPALQSPVSGITQTTSLMAMDQPDFQLLVVIYLWLCCVVPAQITANQTKRWMWHITDKGCREKNGLLSPPALCRMIP